MLESLDVFAIVVLVADATDVANERTALGAQRFCFWRLPRPPGFLSPTRCAFSTPAEGWVFGGMGSWNDGAYWAPPRPMGIG